MGPADGVTNYNTVELDGTTVSAGATVTVLLRNPAGYILIAEGTTVPTTTTAGYAKGAMFIDTDVAAGTGATYLNKGSITSCEFTLVTQA